MATKIARTIANMVPALIQVVQETADIQAQMDGVTGKFARIALEALRDNAFRPFSPEDRRIKVSEIFGQVRDGVRDWFESVHPDAFSEYYTQVDADWDAMDNEYRKEQFKSKRGYRQYLAGAKKLSSDALDHHRFIEQSYTRTQDMKYLVDAWYSDARAIVREAAERFLNDEITVTALMTVVNEARTGKSESTLTDLQKAIKLLESFAGFVGSDERDWSDEDHATIMGTLADTVQNLTGASK